MTMDIQEAEAFLRNIYSQVLQKDAAKLDAEKSFLGLGGDSLLAVYVMSMCREAGITITVADILQNGSLRQLSSQIGEDRTIASHEDDRSNSSKYTDEGHRSSIRSGTSSISTSPEMDLFEDDDTLLHIPQHILENIESMAECALLQEKILISQALNSQAYQCSFSAHLQLPISIELSDIATAWNQTVARHSILRTIFIDSPRRPGHFEQIVLRHVEPEVVLVDPNQHPTSADFETFDPYIADDFQVPHRLTIAKATENDVLLKLDISHSLIDGHSAEIVLRDVLAYLLGRTNFGKATPFSDFVRYQSKRKDEAADSFWSQYVRSAQETNLPVTKKTQNLKSFKTLRFMIDTMAETLDAFCNVNNVTVANICQVAWGIVLKHYCRINNPSFSYISSARQAPLNGILEAVGPFINTLVCTMPLTETTTALEMLHRVHHDYNESMPFQEEFARYLSARQWGNTLMSFRRKLDHDYQSEFGLRCEVIKAFSPTDYDVSLIIQIGRDGLEVNMDYWTSRIDEHYADAILKTFRQAIKSIIADPTSPIRDLNLLSPEHANQILRWNSHVIFPVDDCVHRLIDDTVRKQPEKIAVHAWDGSLTYRELDSCSRRLAGKLASQGVGPEITVAVCMNKTKWYAVATLAIWHAGGTVVPLGIRDPKSRIQTIVSNSKSSILLSDEEHAQRLDSLFSKISKMDESLFQGNGLQSSYSLPSTTSRNAAWIVYTSGSTGVPKGVVLEHRALCSSMTAHNKMFHISPNSRVLQFAAYTFDISMQEIYTTLMFGGCVCVPSEAERMNDLSGAINRFQVNCLGLTPSVAALLRPQDVPTVQQLLLFGEAVKPAVVEAWVNAARVLNAYGPSECTIYATCSEPMKDMNDAPVIGFPINGTCWVTDSLNSNRLCPIGSPGELLIEGPLLARGYLGDSEKTSASFIEDPGFIKDFGLKTSIPRRFYRTGDLVRQNRDGSLTYLGRHGTQIKVRGQRVDVGEVEYWMAKLLSEARTTVVDLIQKEDKSSDTLLVGVLDFKEGHSYAQSTVDDAGLLVPSKELKQALFSLRESLLEKLPAYMVPSIFMPIAQVPLNTSGKTDRRVVHQMVTNIGKIQLRQYMTENGPKNMPETQIGKGLQKLWSHVLKLPIEKIGLQDHFLRMGGDSMTAIQLVEAAKDVKISLKVADVLRYPRLEDLTKFVEQERPIQSIIETADTLPFELWMTETTDRQESFLNIAKQCNTTPDKVQDIYPCSPLQEGLMAITARQPTAYVSRRCFKVSDSINLARFKAAWAQLIADTAILRTRIVSSDGCSLQVVVDEPSVWIEGTNLADYIAQDKTVKLAYGQPLVRYGLVHESLGRSYFVWTAHHSVYDGYGTELLYRNLRDIYRGQEARHSTPYSRFIRHINLPSEADVAAFWTEQLVADDVLSSFPALPNSQYQPLPRITLRREFNITAKRDLNVPLSTILRAAWALVLTQYTGVNDVAFAVTLSGRNASVSGITEMVAPTITTVPLRIRVDRTKGVADFLETLQQQIIDMIPFEHTGLQNIRRLVPLAAPLLDMNHLFVVQPASESNEAIKFPGLDSLNDESTDAFYSHALNIECTLPASRGDSIVVKTLFDDGVISQNDVSTLIEQFTHIVNVISDTAESQQLLSDINNSLSSHDINRILRWNDDNSHDWVDSCLHELVDRVAQIQPDSLAVDAWDGSWTYRQMNVYAKRLAYHLSRRGVGPEVMVGLSLEKSKWAPIAQLAIWQAGGAVVPLGVQHPIERIKAIIDDSKPVAILTDSGQSKALQSLSTPLITVDEQLLISLPDPPTDGPSFTAVQPKNAIWVIYTSGSTGLPKGVVLTHTAVASSLKRQGLLLKITPKTRVFQFASYTFDISMQDTYTTMIYGGCVCIPSEYDRLNHLSETVANMSITLLSLTPSTASVLKPRDMPTVKRIVLMGEPIKPSVIESWLGKAEILNSYGPTECGVSSACGSIEHISLNLRVGHALNGSLWIADASDYNRLVPVGAPGEVLIEGPVLARGYLNDPAKTAQGFVVDPSFVQELGLPSGKRMYRTGDLARQNTDGSLTYVGRRDTQIKIRGQRVDVGEIEHWITKLFLDTKTAVVDVLDNNGQAVLVAAMDFDKASSYCTGALNDEFIPPSDALQQAFFRLRDSLSGRVPGYMVPHVYVPLIKVPINASGKTDRRAVREILISSDINKLTQYMASKRSTSRPPSTDMELWLQKKWAKLLKVPPSEIGVEDHFLQIGGDSIAAIQLVGLAQQEKLRLTISDIFNHGCLEDLAHAMNRNQKSMNYGEINQVDAQPFELWAVHKNDTDAQLETLAAQCNISVEQIQDVYPCTPLQEGLMAITARQPTSYISRRVFEIDDTIDVSRLQNAWQIMADHTPILRTRIVLGQETGSLQVVVDSKISWRYSDNLARYVAEDKAESMPQGKPLARYGLVSEALSGKKYFVWAAHHSAYDGWSAQLLYRQVAAIYLDGELPESIPYTRFLRYLNQQCPGQVANYWKHQLQGDVLAGFPALPHSLYKPQPHKIVKHAIPPLFTKQHSTSIANLLRATWALVVSQFSGMEDIAFAATVSGRNAPVQQISGIVAPIITTVPVRISIDRTMSVADYLQTIQQQAINMIPFEHTGLQKIKQLVPEVASALDLNSLLVVQPAVERNEYLKFPGLAAVDEAGTPGIFHSHALTIDCSLPTNGSEPIMLEAYFDDAVINHSLVDSILEQFSFLTHMLNKAASSDGSVHLNSLQMINPKDMMLIREKNEHVPSIVESCVHDLIISQMQQQPSALAIHSWDGLFSYDELNQFSRRLAKHLISYGVKPGVPVGVCMNKSKWVPVAMLAILQAGGAVLPLGVQHPMDRIEIILEDSKTSIILSDMDQIARLQAITPRLIPVNEALINSLMDSDVSPLSTVRPNDLAWVIYTSGSTATPKGIVLQHSALSSSLLAQGPLYGLGPGMRNFQFAAYTFDVAIEEICCTLMFGGCICIPSEDARMNQLAETISEMQVTTLGLTSTVASLITPDQVPTVERLILGGEAANMSVVEKWLSSSSVKVLNAYGPAECSINSAISQPMKTKYDAPVIGRPVYSNFWIVDTADANRLCPIGVVGELLIEGPVLAQSYLGDPEKTSQSFIFNPGFTQQLCLQGTRRMYRTGDLVRQNTNGTFTYVGRQDTQIKVRGQRLDVSEVEYWIERLSSGIRSAAVDLISQTSDSTQPLLIAVAELKDCANSNEADTVNFLPSSNELCEAFSALRRSLLTKLPSYMVPNTFVPIKSMPLNASGKIDRRSIKERLKACTFEQLMSYTFQKTEPKAVSTRAEAVLQHIWSQVLQVSQSSISADDSFFDMGGDSIMIMKLVNIASTQGINLTVRDVFQHPVLEHMASVSKKNNGSSNAYGFEHKPFSLLNASGPRNLVEEEICSKNCIARKSVVDILPATDSQAAGVVGVLTKRQVERHCFKLDASGLCDSVYLQDVCRQLANSIEVFRTVYIFYQHTLWQVVLESFTNQIPIIECDGSLDECTEEIVQKSKNKPIGLGEFLLDMTIIRKKNSQEHRILFQMSHAIYDGMSFVTIWKTLSRLFEGNSSITSTPFSVYTAYISSQNTAEAKAYWKKLMRGASMPALSSKRSPLDHTPGTMHFTQPMRVENLKSNLSGVTSAVVVKAAWVATLAALTGRNDIVIGDTISGRNNLPAPFADTVGCCASHVPLRVQIEKDWHAIELMKAVQAQHLERLPHEGVGFRELIASCTDWPTSTRFTSIVNHRGTSPASVELGEIRYDIEVFAAKEQVNLYDIAVISEEHDDHLEISLGFCSASFSHEFAHSTIQQLCKIVNIFMTDPQSTVSAMEESGWPCVSGTISTITSRHGTQILDVNVVDCWIRALASKRGLVDIGASESTTFFEQGGDLIDAACLASTLQQQYGFKVTLDDILDHPTLESLASFIGQI